jgi:hypothetical protein
MSETVELPEDVKLEEASDRVKPWTVKGIAPEERNAAIAAADRQDMTIGEWLTRAIRTQVQADHQADRAPVPIGYAGIPAVDRQSDLSDVERMIALARQIAEVNKSPIPRSITRATHSIMREHLSAIKASRTDGGGGSDRRDAV